MKTGALLGITAVLATAWVVPGWADEKPDRGLSPDGKLLAFECAIAKGTGICLEDQSSGATRNLIRLPGHNRNPVFSPDGLFIAFIAEIGQRQIVTVTDHIGHSWPVADVTGIDQVNWSPDAVWLVLAPQRGEGNTDVFRITAGGTKPQWLTQTEHLSERSPYYSADGQICYQLTYGVEQPAATECFALPL